MRWDRTNTSNMYFWPPCVSQSDACCPVPYHLTKHYCWNSKGELARVSQNPSHFCYITFMLGWSIPSDYSPTGQVGAGESGPHKLPENERWYSHRKLQIFFLISWEQHLFQTAVVLQQWVTGMSHLWNQRRTIRKTDESFRNLGLTPISNAEDRQEKHSLNK